MVWSVTASSSAVKLSRSISSCIQELNASTVRAALMPPAVRTARVAAAALAEHHDLAARLVGGDGRAATRRPRPAHQDIGDIAAKRRTSHAARPPV